MKKIILFTFVLAVGLQLTSWAQDIQNNPVSNHGNKFEQLGTILPTPNSYRTASGAPGESYWQQRADYDIKCSLDEKALQIKGSEKITYFNNSPDGLTYLWLQLDENEHSSVDNSGFEMSSELPKRVLTDGLKTTQELAVDNDWGDKILKITDVNGKPLNYTINKTMMRVDLPKELKHGEQFVMNIDWTYQITDRMTVGGRGGYEYFPEDGNYLFTITQWFPRLCVYSDVQGWQNHQFTGRGEFALTFGNYKVAIDVPADHVVGATGACINYAQILTPTQLQRLNKAKISNDPVEIVTLDEAKKAEQTKSTARKTWIFEAKNVRDFAWGSSRKFVWDGMNQHIDRNNNNVLCMSFYGKEAYNLYRKFSSRAVAHTVKTYSDFTIPYPYPVAQSVEASNGMEYPMICFNYGRTEKDGTYSEATKNGMLGVVIHEVGHNFFPMIINSDERQWTWMDEGLNSFVEYLTEELWDNKFPTKKGNARSIVDYMKLPKNELEPIMTNSENIARFGPNAYTKPATALNILRETIMGRKLFDYAFKEYARRWAFKHPSPADLFRTMEDASGVDLDWFWRGWFYGTNPVDIALENVKVGVPDFDAQLPEAGTRTVKVAKPAAEGMFDDISKIRNREDKDITFLTEKVKDTQDFYWKYNRGLVNVDTVQRISYKQDIPFDMISNKSETDRYKDMKFYQLTFANKGGLVMPIIVEFTFEDGSKYLDRISAQIWRKNEQTCSKTYTFNKVVKSIQLDPLEETADIDISNNYWGDKAKESKVQMFKKAKAKITARGQSVGPNPMQYQTK